jgi:hypothetical protein
MDGNGDTQDLRNLEAIRQISAAGGKSLLAAIWPLKDDCSFPDINSYE